MNAYPQHEEQSMNCQLAQRLSETDVSGSDLLVNATLRAHASAAEEELGDTIHESDEFIRACVTETGIDIPIDEARAILGSLAGCLQRRYMGDCQSAASCTGRLDMEKRLSSLGLHKEEAK